MNNDTIVEHLGIEITEVGDDLLPAPCPLTIAPFSPIEVVHGGANVVLAESLGSIAGAHVIDMS